jgi:hypothetical protein
MADDPNQNLKNELGNEYDLYSSLKDKFQGFDKDGQAVFKDEAGDVTAFNKTDFGKLNSQLKKDYGEKSYEDTFNQNQFDDISKQGNKFQGFAGDNAIFRNEKGDLENFGSQGGFASFLKKQQPDTTFDITKQGQSQRSNTNYQAGADFLGNKQIVQQKTGSGFTGYNPQAAVKSLGSNIANPGAYQSEMKSAVNPNIAMKSSPQGTFQSFKAKQPTAPAVQTQAKPTAPPTLGDMAKGMAMAKIGDEFSSLKAKGSNLLAQKTDQAQDYANNAISGATGLSTQMLTNPADAAKQAAINKAAEVTGFSANTLLNPEQAAKDAALSKLTSTTGIDANLLKGDIAQNVQNLAVDRAKGAGLDYLKANDPTGMSQYAGLLNGNVIDNAKNAAIDQAKQQGLDFLKENDPTGGALGGLGEYAGLLKGNVTDNVKNLAVEKAKQEAIKQAALATGLDPTGGIASGALGVGKALFSGGSSEDRGRAAAQAAARAAAAYFTGGLATEQNLQLANAGTNKALSIADKNVGSDLKPVVQTAKGVSDLGQILTTGGVKLALDGVGNFGAGIGRSFSNSGKALKNITSGNIEEGLTGLGKGAANLAIQTFLKNPMTIAKGIGNLGKAAVSKAAAVASNAARSALNFINPFCFAPNTEILMANGKYKKIKLIKLGDEVMLGGKVTAIGQSTSDDMYLYDGVEVSGGHTLYENGKWIRTKQSKYAVKMEIEDALVYPMDTENHLIVTKGQVWADMSEIDNTYDKKDTDILVELNNQTEANKRIDLFLKLYFNQKRK